MHRNLSIVICGLRGNEARRVEAKCQIPSVRLHFVESHRSRIHGGDVVFIIRGVRHRLSLSAVRRIGRDRVIYHPSRSVDRLVAAVMKVAALRPAA